MPAEHRFRTLIEKASGLYGIVLESGALTYVSPAASSIGLDPDALLGTSLFDLVHPDDAGLMRAAFGQASLIETRLRQENGGWLPVEISISEPIDDPAIAGRIVHARDIRPRYEARRAQEASEADYRRLFEETRDAICIGTVDGRLIDINPAGLRLFEFEQKEEMLQLDIARDLYWNPKDRQRMQEVFRSQGYVEDLELELKTRTGKRLRVLETATAIRDAEGEIVGFQGILRDVTEHRKLEEQLRQSQKMEAVGRLAGGVSHDFNNLLTAINGYSELVLARMDDDNPMRHALMEIRKAGKRAADLTRRLLTLSRHQMVSPRRLSLNRVVLDMEKLLHRVLGEDVELATILDPDLHPLHADLGQIEQILLNLAVNARDAMPEGGRLEIETRNVNLPDQALLPGTAKQGGYLLLAVRDNGEGMSREVRQNVFDPFFTTKEKSHNSGMGLAIVYGIVQQNNGHIELESRSGEGSTFHVYLPAEVEEEPVQKDTETPGELPRGSETVLLVEDEDSVRDLVQQILELQGYRVLPAANARQAVALCEGSGKPPDLLLTDVVMPERSGPALAEDLQLRYQNLKILFMSGYTDSHTGVRLVTEQRAAFLPKPFSPDLLLHKVRAVIDQRT